MRNISRASWAIVAAVLVLFVGCGGDDPVVPPPGGGTDDWAALLAADVASDWPTVDLLFDHGVQFSSFNGGVLRAWSDRYRLEGPDDIYVWRSGEITVTSRLVNMTQFSDARLRFSLVVEPGQTADVVISLRSYVPGTPSLTVMTAGPNGVQEGNYDISLGNGLGITEGRLEVNLGNEGNLGAWAEIRDLQLVTKN